MRLTTFIILLFFATATFSQLGGVNGFGILTLPSGSRSAGLGGTNISALGDLALAFENPAVLDSLEPAEFTIQFSPYFADISLTNVAGIIHTKLTGDLFIGLSYLGYGDFTETDQVGNEIGSFTAQDYFIEIAKSHRIGPFSLGVGLKFVQSRIEAFSSSGVAFDLGGLFLHPTTDFQVGLAVKNIGFKFSNFFEANPTDLPTDIQIGLSFKPKYMPARVNVSASNLLTDELDFFGTSPLDGENPNAFNRVFRRVNIGLEILLGNAVNLLVGYNHLRRQELSLEQSAFGAGFSFGFLIKVKKLQFRFSQATYHAAGGISTFGIQGNLKGLSKIF